MQIQCQGHGTKLFAAWPTVNFHFDKPCCIVLSLFAFALSLPTSPFCVLEPSSCAAPHQRGLVSPLMFQSLCLVYLCHLSPYCCPRPHLFGRLSAVHFMTAHTVNPVFSAEQIDCPSSDSMDMLSVSRPPFLLSLNLNRLAWRTVAVCVCLYV